MNGKDANPTSEAILYDILFPEGPGTAANDSARRRRMASERPARPEKPKDGAGGDNGGKGDHDDELERRCRKLLAEIERLCPGTLPPGPLPEGEIAQTIDVDEKNARRLFAAALGVDDRRRKKPVIWEQAGSELLVHLHLVRVAVLDGIILVGIPVETVETGRTEVTVAFGVGTPERLAGMVVTTEAKPRGPAAIVDLWGEALTAFAWQTLLDVIERLAATTGVDTGGAPLLPGALFAERGRLGLIPQAAHTFEAPRR